MTVGLLYQILQDNHIPEDAELLSDSGWECDATKMDGVFYHRERNTVVFTQGGNVGSHYYFSEKGWEVLYGGEKVCQN